MKTEELNGSRSRRNFLKFSALGITLPLLSYVNASGKENEKAPRVKANKNNAWDNVDVSHHTVMLNDLKMHYVTAGAGEPVVLLHGFPETSYAWRKIIPALSKHYFVIAPDLRGCGDTDRPDDSYDKKTVAGDIYGLIQHLKLGPVNLVSHDVGMMVGYAFAANYPAQVKRLVLMEAALPGLGLEELYNAEKYPRMYHLALFDAPNGLAEALIEGREAIFVSHFMRQQTYDPTGPDELALEEYSRRLSAPGALRGGIEYFRAHKIDAAQNKEHAKTKLKMPVLTVGGTASFGANLAPQIRPLVENLHSIMIEDCGHYLAEEQPEKLSSELLNFFKTT